MRGRAALAASLSTVTVVLVVVVPLSVMLVLFAGQAMSVYEFVQTSAAAGQIPGREEFLNNPTVARLMKKLGPYWAQVDLKPVLLSAMNSVSSIAVGLSKAILLNTLAVIVKFFVMVALLFFFFRDGERWCGASGRWCRWARTTSWCSARPSNAWWAR